MEVKNYKIDFVQRTLELLKTNYGRIQEDLHLEVTFLMNCLLGLIVTVTENKESKNSFFSENIDDEFAEKIPSTVWYLHKEDNENNRERHYCLLIIVN
jgi:hypothetical protein